MSRASLFILLLAATLLAQSQEGTWENNIGFNYIIKDLKFNTTFGHRTAREKSNGKSSNRLVFTELNQFITKKINPRLSVSIGYKYREVKNDHRESRLTQQLVFIHKRSFIRLASRIRLEQRFRENFDHRYRYRFSIDFPLHGRKLDSKEPYLLASNEILLERSSSSNQLDNRVTVGLGYVLSNIIKIQAEYTHRMEKLNTEIDHRPFVTTSVFFNIN